MVKATSDKILDELQLTSSASVAKLAKTLGVSKDEVLNAAKYLEQDGVITIDKGFTSTNLILKQTNFGAPAIPPPPMPRVPSHKSTTAPTMPPHPIKNNEPILPNNQFPQPHFPTNPAQTATAIPLQNPIETQTHSPDQTQPAEQKALQETHEPFPLTQKPHEPPHLNKMMSKPPIENLAPTKKVSFAHKEDFVNLYPDNLIDDDPISPSQAPRFTMRIPEPEPGMMSPQSIMSRELIPVEQEPVVLEQPPEPQRIVQTVYEQPAQKTPQQPVQNSFPSYATSTVDKIDYLIDLAHKKIDHHDYGDLHLLYRQIFEMFDDAAELSPNEYYLLGDKINDLFARIRRIYVIEQVT